MHHIYHTEAFVLKSTPTGEDSKTLFLYTRELGLIRARAQALRKLSSKLRYVLQDFSHAQVDLVRGKEIWRVTTAVPKEGYNVAIRSSKADHVLGRISSLLVRLVAGEEPNEEIFSIIIRVYELLSTTNTDEQYRAIELLFVSRILIALGYLPRESFGLAPDEAEIMRNLSDITYQHRLIRDINLALSASQL